MQLVFISFAIAIIAVKLKCYCGKFKILEILFVKLLFPINHFSSNFCSLAPVVIKIEPKSFERYR